MSFNINKAKESFGIFAPVEFNNSAAIKQFSGAFSIGTSKRGFFYNIHYFLMRFLTSTFVYC